MHVIHNPDLKGFACDLEQNAIELPITNRRGLPYIPHYNDLNVGENDCDPSDIETTLKAFKVDVFPNPASNFLSLELNHFHTNAEFQLHSVTGLDIFTKKITRKEQTFELTALKNGIYFYKIVQDSKIVFIGKLIIIR